MFPLILFAALLASLNASAQGYPPDEAPKHMTMLPDLQVQLVAGEPMIARPVCLEFDDCGDSGEHQHLED